jgi:hypothetical protein
MVGVSYAPLARRLLKLFYDEQDGGRRGSAAFFQRHNADITNQKASNRRVVPQREKRARVFVGEDDLKTERQRRLFAGGALCNAAGGGAA